jgi:hypothetical protein
LTKAFFFREDSANFDDFRLEQEVDITIIDSRDEDKLIYCAVASETGDTTGLVAQHVTCPTRIREGQTPTMDDLIISSDENL